MIPVWVRLVWRDEPGEMDGLVKRDEMRVKSFGEKVGVGDSGFEFGFGFRVEVGVGLDGREGQLMSGFPGWDSHEENGRRWIGLSVEERIERRIRWGICECICWVFGCSHSQLIHSSWRKNVSESQQCCSGRGILQK